MEQEKTKRYFWILLDVVILEIVLYLVFAMPAVGRFANSFISKRTITVSAEGKTTVSPDLAQASFSVVSRGKNPEELADSNNQKISAVIQFLKATGVESKDIKTTGYNLSPNYKYDPQTERNFITGYTLTQTVSVKIRDLGKVSKIIGGLTPLGVNQIGGVNFTVDDPEKFLAVARTEALQKAKAKAAEMAGQSGVSLGRVLNVAESQGGFPIPYPQYYGSYGKGGASALDVSPPPVAAPTIEPGTQEIRDQITITYELR